MTISNPSGEPIMIPCEGAGCPPATTVGISGMCAMCGRWWVTESGAIPRHQRDDLIARIERGDFG